MKGEFLIVKHLSYISAAPPELPIEILLIIWLILPFLTWQLKWMNTSWEICSYFPHFTFSDGGLNSPLWGCCFAVKFSTNLFLKCQNQTNIWNVRWWEQIGLNTHPHHLQLKKKKKKKLAYFLYVHNYAAFVLAAWCNELNFLPNVLKIELWTIWPDPSSTDR